MADNATLLIYHILPMVDMRQWVISFPFQLRFLFARYPVVMSKVFSIVTRFISTHLIQKYGAKHRQLAYRALFKAHIDGALLAEIRDETNKGLAIGKECFKKEI